MGREKGKGKEKSPRDEVGVRQRNGEKEQKGVLLRSIWVLLTLQVNEYLIVTLIKKRTKTVLLARLRIHVKDSSKLNAVSLQNLNLKFTYILQYKMIIFVTR